MHDPHQHVLDNAMNWVERAHDATGRQGVSAAYDLNHGWQPPYPETSGYLIPTLLRSAEALRRPGLADRAQEVGGWLCDLQLTSGAFPGGVGIDGAPVVFDVGQIMLGLHALWERTEEPALVKSLHRSADWLASAQEPSGAWSSHLGHPNTYSSRVTWAVLQAWTSTGETTHLRCAERSLRWILDQVDQNGWIGGMAFAPDWTPWTHTIAYTLRGLLRCADLVGGELGQECASAAIRAAVELSELRTPLFPLLPGEIGAGFVPKSDYACLTGDAQMVTVWLDVATRLGDPALRTRCGDVVERLSELQIRQPFEPAALGALPGSWPLTGGFEPLAFPSWSTKFLADAALALVDAERAAQV